MKPHGLFLRVFLLTSISALFNLAFGNGIAINYDPTTAKNYIWDVNLITAVASAPVPIQFGGGNWNSFALDKDAGYFYVYTADQSIYTFDLATRSLVKQAKLSPSILLEDIITVKQGVLMGLSSGRIYKIDPSTGLNSLFTDTNNRGSFKLGTFISDTANSKFYITNASDMLYIFDSSTGAVTTKQLNIAVQNVILGKDGKLLAITPGSNSNTFYTIDPLTGTSTVLNTISLGFWYGNTFSSDPKNNKFYILGSGAILYTFDLSTGNILNSPPPTLTGITAPQLLKAVPTDLTYIALGDSYSSGEGACSDGQCSYEAGTDTSTNHCHRAPIAWSTAQPGGDSKMSAPGIPGLNVERHFYACSGALTGSVIGPCNSGAPESIRTCDNSAPDNNSQIDQLVADGFLNDFSGNRGNLDGSNGMISMTIGGNNVLFGPILQFCGETFFSGCLSNPFSEDPSANAKNGYRSVKQTLEDSLAALESYSKDAYGPDLHQTYSQIRTLSNNTPIFILGYPKIFPEQYGHCTLNEGLFSSEDLAYFRDYGNRLNETIARVAAAEGVHFVPVGSFFEGHGVCEKSDETDYIVPFNLMTQFFGLFGSSATREFFHPNAAGQLAYATALRKAILDTPEGKEGKVPPNPPLASSPLSLQMIQATASTAPIPTIDYLEIEPVTSLPCNNGNRYAPNMQVRIQGQGFSANAAIHSETMADFGHFKTTLGPFTADEQGRLDTIITIPENTPLTGGARLLATGLGANDGARLLFVWIALVASSEPNTLDNGIPDICGKGNTTSSFTGRVWLDANGNGIQDANENGLAGVTVFLDYAETGVYDNGEPSAITDSTGHYAITRLQTGGHYTVAVDTTTLPPGLKPTFDPDGIATPNSIKSTVNAGWTSEHNDFGYAQNSGSTQTTTIITTTTPDPSTIGQAVTVNYSVTATSGTPTGNVAVSDGAGTTCTGTVVAGHCALTFTSPGNKALTAAYAGDANFATSTSAPVAHTVTNGNNPNTTFTGPATTGSGQVTAQITGESGCGFSQARLTAVSTIPATPPSGYTFPHGLFTFTITGCPNGTLTLQITYPQVLPTDTKYWKYGKTPDNHTPHWYELPTATISGNQVTLSLTDGGLGDDDLTANGTIVDDGGPGGPSGSNTITPIPTLSELGLLLLGLSLATTIWWIRRNKPIP